MPRGIYPHINRPKHSEETKRKMSLASKGKKKSIAHSQSMSKARILKPTRYWLGKKRVDMAGDKNPLWNGGNSRGYKTGYYSTEYKQWRMKVFERDNFTCQVCKRVGVYLTAHHIKSFAHFPELRFEVNNGITLCEECHKLTDNYKGRAKFKNNV